jgi:hypothetical protein
MSTKRIHHPNRNILDEKYGLPCCLNLEKVFTIFGFQYKISIARKVNEKPYVIVGKAIDKNKFTAFKLAKYNFQANLITFINKI